MIELDTEVDALMGRLSDQIAKHGLAEPLI